MDKHLFTQVLIHFLLLSGKPTKADSKHHASFRPEGRVRFARWIAGAKICHSSACKTSCE